MKGGCFLLGGRPKSGYDLIVLMKKGPKWSGFMAAFGGKPQHKRAGMNPAPYLSGCGGVVRAGFMPVFGEEDPEGKWLKSGRRQFGPARTHHTEEVSSLANL